MQQELEIPYFLH